MILISGIAVVDMIASGLPRVAAPGELVFGSIGISLGGHACNVSTDLARLGLPGSDVRVVFAAGRDMFGRYIIDTLRKQGVCAEAVMTGNTPTSLDLILVAKGEDRRFHVDPGANIVMPAGRVSALIEKYRPRLFYVGGAGLLNRLDAKLDAVLRKAKRAGARTFVDVVTPYKQSWTFLKKALPWTDFFHCNDDEAAAITGERNQDKALKKIHKMGARHVFITMGEKGVAALVPGAVLHVPAFKVPVVEPTGAGDAFSAGLMLKIHGTRAAGRAPTSSRSQADSTVEDWKSILVYASACGAVCCGGVGASTSVSAAAVESLLRRHGSSLARGIAIKENEVRK